MPLTGHTPHRTRRAAFPHRAPCKTNCSTTILVYVYIDSRLCQRMCPQQVIKSLPRITLPLTSSVQPFKQALCYSAPEAVQTFGVIRDSVVMVISNKYLIQLLYHGFHGLCSHSPYQLMDFFALLCKFLPAGFPLHPEFTVPAVRTVMCKPQKCKRVRPFSFFFTFFFRKSPEFYETALAFFQGHSEALHPAFQMFIEFLRFSPILEARHKVIGVDHEPSKTLQFRLYALLEPPYQHIVHVDVCYYRRAHRTL